MEILGILIVWLRGIYIHTSKVRQFHNYDLCIEHNYMKGQLNILFVCKLQKTLTKTKSQWENILFLKFEIHTTFDHVIFLVQYNVNFF